MNDRKPIMLTLGEASKACNVTKSGISKAIKSGRLSANKNDIGQYEIDPAELFRVFPVKTGNSEPVSISLHNEPNGLHVVVETLRELLSQVEGERDDLRSQRDRLLNIVEEQAGNIKQLTYKPIVQNTNQTLVRPVFWVILALVICVVLLWYFFGFTFLN